MSAKSKYANPAGAIIPVDLFAPRKRVFGKTNNMRAPGHRRADGGETRCATYRRSPGKPPAAADKLECHARALPHSLSYGYPLTPTFARRIYLYNRRHPLKIQLNLTDKSTGRDS